jgi:twitching motility protein PilT
MSRYRSDWERAPDFPKSTQPTGEPETGRYLPVINLAKLLSLAVDEGASDVHLRANVSPRLRVDGHLDDVALQAVSAAELEQLLVEVLPPERQVEFGATNEADFALSVPGLGRFRGNAFRERGTVGIVLRRVLSSVDSLKEMGLPPVVAKLAEESRGLVLVTGPTGSGKTTTLAGMVDHINNTRPVNIMTIEDPIEVLHPNKMAMVAQREIGTDTGDYAQAMRRVLRQDPDVILIGEMRDAETVAAALSAAETGHLVLSTLHTVNATSTINRIVDFFPAFQHHQVRLTLASSLRGVVCQRLLERNDAVGRVPAVEVMVVTGRIAERIVHPDAGRGETIQEMIDEGEWYGMQSFDQSLLALYRDGHVSLAHAMSAASKPHDFKLKLEKAGLVATGR